MHVSTQQRILYAIAGSFLLGAGGALYWSTSEIAESDFASSRVATRRDAPRENPREAEGGHRDDDAARMLRGPLYDLPPPPSKPLVVATPRAKPPTPTRQLGLTLIGTIIDAHQSLAIVADASGEFDVKGIGDSLELEPKGVRIGRIDSEQITLLYQGSESTIRLIKDSNPVGSSGRGSGGRGGRGNNRRKNR